MVAGAVPGGLSDIGLLHIGGSEWFRERLDWLADLRWPSMVYDVSGWLKMNQELSRSLNIS